MSDEILSKQLQLEKQIAGLWYNPDNMTTWEFYTIDKDVQGGNVLISYPKRNEEPIRGSYLGYEPIWVNDDKLFLDLIYRSFPIRQQHQIWFNGNSLKIEYINPNLQQKEYLSLNKV